MSVPSENVFKNCWEQIHSIVILRRAFISQKDNGTREARGVGGGEGENKYKY